MNFHELLSDALIFSCTLKKRGVDFTKLISKLNALLIFFYILNIFLLIIAAYKIMLLSDGLLTLEA